MPSEHQSAAFVFGETINNSGFSDGAFWFVFGIGLLMAQYTITGYDASAHMSEETRTASRAAAWGMVMAVVASVVFGFILLVAVTFAVPDVQGTLDATHERRGLHLDHLAGRRLGGRSCCSSPWSRSSSAAPPRSPRRPG